MQFVCNEIPRFAFGFFNPNHAAAMICAVAPFLWGWWIGKVERRGEGGQWRFAVPYVLNAALCVMLAMTYSRTGMVVFAMEAAMWWGWERSRPLSAPRREGASGTVMLTLVGAAVVAGLVWWMWPRLTLDGAILNRPKIWLAGLKLAAANPLGVGLGKSGALASAFLLPESITVRTLVNSHLTLLAEMGALVGGLWFAFLAAAIASGRDLPRTRIAFAGLAVSAFSASVFDWHVLFDFAEMGGLGLLNFVLSWVLFAGFVCAGVTLIVRGRALRVCGACVLGAALCCVMIMLLQSSETPRVEDGFAVFGAACAPRTVYHDAEWSLRALKGYFPEGARVRIESGVAPCADAKEVWLFGAVAESSDRFPGASVTVVSPPEYYEPGENVKRVE